MEVKGIEVETGLLDKAGPSDQMLETKTEVKPTKLTWSRNHVLLTLCIVLGVICLGELIIIFIVNGKRASISQPPLETGTESGAAAGPSSSPDATEDVRKAPDSHRCPDNWLFFDNDCFYLSKERKTWSESREFCKNNAGDLVVPTLQIKDFLMKQASIEYWIGLQYDTSWKWVNNMTPSSEPTGESKHGHCAMLGKNPPRSWESAKCVFNLHFICQK